PMSWPRRSTSWRGCCGTPAMKRPLPWIISRHAPAGVEVGTLLSPHRGGDRDRELVELGVVGGSEEHDRARLDRGDESEGADAGGVARPSVIPLPRRAAYGALARDARPVELLRKPGRVSVDA